MINSFHAKEEDMMENVHGKHEESMTIFLVIFCIPRSFSRISFSFSRVPVLFDPIVVLPHASVVLAYPIFILPYPIFVLLYPSFDLPSHFRSAESWLGDSNLNQTFPDPYYPFRFCSGRTCPRRGKIVRKSLGNEILNIFTLSFEGCWASAGLSSLSTCKLRFARSAAPTSLRGEASQAGKTCLRNPDTCLNEKDTRTNQLCVFWFLFVHHRLF